MVQHVIENNVTRAKCRPGDEIVISGMAGRFPNSRSVNEFEHNLYNKTDMCDDDERRWRHESNDIPKRSGKVYNMEKFDSSFFGYNIKQANILDPQMRILLEHAYEAVIDAGINPNSLRGTKTGVFIGACFAETENLFYQDLSNDQGSFILTSIGRAMLANRISSTLDLHGPSCVLDTACSSSMYAINAAFNAISSGECEAAIVGASNATLHEYITLNFVRLGVLAKDGFSRPFDQDAAGYVRAEAFSCLFLQKAKHAKRIYSTLVYSKTNCDGFKPESIVYPSGAIQAELYEEFYREINVNPNCVGFVEAHSTGTVVGDPEECLAIDQVFCKDREKALPVGSIKSNMGHAESAAGLCSLIKVVLALENKLIPPNINFANYRTGIEGFDKKRLQVVTEPQPFDETLAAVNSFGFGGANGHCLLRAHNKEKINGGRPLDKLPRLVNWDGRNEEACNAIFDDILTRPLDAEYIGLLHSTKESSISGNVYRSFGLFTDEENENAKCVNREVQHFPGKIPKIVFVFSGIGSQWCEMGTQLLEIPLFKNSVEKCHEILVPKGINLMNILTSNDESIFDNVVHSYVGIAAIQIGLCDILEEIGVKPDLIVGHSVGELGCAYADRCLTAEETMLCAYAYGMASIESDTVKNAMSAVDVGYQQVKPLLPDSITSMISSPKEDLENLLADLNINGMFSKEIQAVSGIIQSRNNSKIYPKLLAYLNVIISNPKERSKKWLSSTVSKDKLSENQLCSAEYLANSLLSSIPFEKTLAQLPVNGVAIEIAPHGLLQTDLKKALPNYANISLTQRDNTENLVHFLTALGKIYLAGVDMSIENLYPKIEFPVSRGTPRIAHLIKWNHKKDMYVMNFSSSHLKIGEKRFTVSLENPDYAYIAGHAVDGKCLFPGIGYLQLVWETFVSLNNGVQTDMNIEFEDVKFLRATRVQPTSKITFSVMVNRGSGYFEVIEGSMAVVTGYIREIVAEEEIDVIPVPKGQDTYILPTKDFYKELRIRGYHYTGMFKGILEGRSDGLTGQVKWDNNWVTFIDSILQLCLLQIDTRSLMLPTGIDKLTIRARQHFNYQLTKKIDDETEINYFDIRCNKHLGLLQAGGIEIKGLQAFPISRRFTSGEPILEVYKFVPYISAPPMNIKNATRVCAQYVLENTHKMKIGCVELHESEELEPLSCDIKEGFENNPQVVADHMILTSKEIKSEIPFKNEPIDKHKKNMVAIATNCLSDAALLETVIEQKFDYLILRETTFDKSGFKPPVNYNIIFAMPIDATDQTIIMLQRIPPQKVSKGPTVIKITSHDTQFEWLEPLKNALKTGPTILYAQGEKTSGIIGLFNCIRREAPTQSVRYFFIDDVNAPPFNIDSPFYLKQLNLNMAANVYRNGQWGNYRHLLMDSLSKDESASNHVFANLAKPGDLSSFKWFEGPLKLKTTENLIKIQYSALNFRDVMLASGKIAFEVFCTDRLQRTLPLGIEFSGVNEAGERVMGINMAGALSSHTAKSDGSLIWKCPDMWTLAEAATVPIVYSTVYIALIVRGNIQKGDSILIHSGTGGVGLAAIRVSLAYGLTVFTTVGSPEKREYLLNNFPQLKSNHIGNSRDVSFEKMIKIQTKGRGVDFVLNSLAGDKLIASIRCLAAKGKFLEIGKFDLINNNKIGLRDFLREITFHSIHLDNVTEANRSELESAKTIIERDIKDGVIQPLPTTVYPANDLTSAFRYLGSGKHIGKVIIKIRENPEDNEILPVPVSPRLLCDPNSSYIILGGLGGFGLELADWLIIRGARQLVLSSRSGISKPYQQHRINIWKQYKVRVTIATSDITTRSGCANIIEEAQQLGPVRAIFNLAVQLQDDAFENQTVEKYCNSFGPKARATEYFDQLSRELCPQLEHFVVFSSISTGRGNIHQTNYGMTNSVMERIMEQRHNDNLPGVAIQWGAIGDVGIVADLLQDNINLEIGGTITQGISSCLEELDNLLFYNSPIVSSMVVAEKRSYGINTDIKSVMMKILGIKDINTISMDAKLSELGMDSMAAVEMKQTLERDFELVLTPQELRVMTFGQLLEYQEKLKKKAEERKNQIDSNCSNSLFKHLGDISMANETIIHLASQNVTNSNSAVVMIPGLESCASTQWHDLAANIKHAVFCLQLCNIKSVDEVPTTISQVTNDLVSKLKKNIKQVFIVGHSFGSIAALHLAAQLEKLNIQTQVLVIDGSPEYLKKWGSSLEEEALQLTALEAAYRSLLIDDDVEFIEKLMPLAKFSDRLDKLLQLKGAASQNKSSLDLIKQLATNAYDRSISLAGLNLDSVSKIGSKISLARVKNVVDIDEDYGLNCFTTDGTVDVKHFDGDHGSVLDRAEFLECLLEFVL